MAKETISAGKAVGGSVSVASKMPMDFVLQLHDMVKQHEPVMGGGVREFTIAQKRPGAQTYTIQGNSYPQNKGPHQQLAHGYAITHGIPRAFWDEWLAQQAEHDAVKNGMLFAHVEQASAIAEAKDREKEKSGLERVSQTEIQKFGLETASRQAA